MDDREKKHLFCCRITPVAGVLTADFLMWGSAANVLHLFGRQWQELMELSEDGRYRCASLPDVHVGEPFHLLLHVLLEFSWTQQHLTDGADGSLTVIEWHLLLTWEKNRKRQERMRFIYHHKKKLGNLGTDRLFRTLYLLLLTLKTPEDNKQNHQVRKSQFLRPHHRGQGLL